MYSPTQTHNGAVECDGNPREAESFEVFNFSMSRLQNCHLGENVFLTNYSLMSLKSEPMC